MKSFMSKIICAFLSAVLLFSTFSVGVFASDECNCGTAPIILIKGRGTIIEDKNDSNSKELGSLDKDLLLKELPSLAANYYYCYKIDNFSSFNKKLSEFLKEMFAGYQLDENGNITNDSGREPTLRWEERLYDTKSEYMTDEDWLKYRVTPDHTVWNTGKITDDAYLMYKYSYYFDCRLDFCEVADDLNEYIQYVKELTDHSKVKIVCRCLGTSMFAAYLSKYGYEDIESVMFYNALYNGSIIANNLYTGNVYLDADSVDNIANEYLDESTILSILAQIVSLANKTYQLDMTASYFNKTLVKVGKQILPDALLATYATCPGYWTMVSYDTYDEAIDFVFGERKEKYKSLIEKLDYYHENVAANINDLIKEMGNNGVDVYYVAKYNSQVYPVVPKEYAVLNSDNVISVSQQVPGTIAANIGKRLDENYILRKHKQGQGKYLSYDGCIDASQTMFPDTTWYIKDLEHDNYSGSVDLFILRIMLSNGEFTIDSDPDYPQFLVSEENDSTTQLYPLGKEHPGKSYESRSFIEIFRYLFSLIFELLGIKY